MGGIYSRKRFLCFSFDFLFQLGTIRLQGMKSKYGSRGSSYLQQIQCNIPNFSTILSKEGRNAKKQTPIVQISLYQLGPTASCEKSHHIRNICISSTCYLAVRPVGRTHVTEAVSQPGIAFGLRRRGVYSHIMCIARRIAIIRSIQQPHLQ